MNNKHFEVWWDNFDEQGTPVGQTKRHILKNGTDKTLCGVYVPTGCDAEEHTGSAYGLCKRCAKSLAKEAA